MNGRLFVVAAALAAIALAKPAWSQTAGSPHGGHLMISPSELKWGDVPSLPPGAKLALIEGPLNEAVPVTFRLKFPANFRIPAHWHPGIEHVTVISGTFHMGMGDALDTAKTRALSAGSVAIMPAREHHFAWTGEETIVQIHGVGPWGFVYVNPADDPRKK